MRTAVPVERLRHRFDGRKRIVVHAASGDAWMGRTLCGAHEGRWGYELQVVSASGKTVDCKRCLASIAAAGVDDVSASARASIQERQPE